MKNLIYKSLIPVFITCIMIVNLVHTMDVKADPVFAVKEWNRNGSLSSEEGTIVYDKIIVTSDTGNEDFVWEDQYINIKLEDKESTVVKAVSADADIVTVKDLYKISSGFYSFTIIPMGVGKTQITLTDQYGQTIKKDVEVTKSYMDGITEYYVKVTLTPSNYSQESIAEFPNLPLVDENGYRIYYTVRETKVPEGFYSLADFNLLTGMDLFNGGATQQHDFMFEIENTRNMELPVTGGSRMRTIVMIGTILVTLGSAAIILMLNRKKLKEVIPRINL